MHHLRSCVPTILNGILRRARLAVLGASGAAMALALTLIVAPGPAQAATGWVTHVFSISYDGSGTFSYNAQGPNGDTGCHMDVGEGARFAFDQLWTVKVGFKKTGKTTYDTKVESILHVDGPNSSGGNGASHIIGKQTNEPNETCEDLTYNPDTGKFDCTSSTDTLTAFNKPEMEISRKSSDLVFTGDTFIEGHWKYSGQDSIPSDIGISHGCATYDDQEAYGSDMIPGLTSIAKVPLKVSTLAALAKHKSVIVKVSLGHNTQLPRQTTCDSTFGSPNSCVINKQSMNGVFKVIRMS